MPMPNFSFLACLEVAYHTFPGGWRVAGWVDGRPDGWLDGNRDNKANSVQLGCDQTALGKMVKECDVLHIYMG